MANTAAERAHSHRAPNDAGLCWSRREESVNSTLAVKLTLLWDVEPQLSFRTFAVEGPSPAKVYAPPER